MKKISEPMRSKLLLGLIYFFLFLFLMFVGIITANATTYYFSSVSGDNDRTSIQAQNSATPWQTIGKLNANWAIIQPGDFILFKGGETFYGRIDIGKSGTSSAKITIGSYGTGQAIFSGMRTLTAWTSLGNNIWEMTSPISTLPSTRAKMVVLDNYPAAISRWPNRNTDKSGYLFQESFTYRGGGTTGGGTLVDNQLPASPSWTGAEVVMRKARWVLDVGFITNHTGTNITYNNDIGLNGNGGRSPTAGYGYFIQNDPDAIDLDWEWYHNVSTDKIRMKFNGNPSAHIVEVAELDNLLFSSAKDHITIDNVIFRGCDKIALDFNGGTGITIQNSSVLYSGRKAIDVSGMTNLIIENCQIKYNHDFGIKYSGTGAIIRDNVIKNCGYIAGMGDMDSDAYKGITTGTGSEKTLIEYNIIDSIGSMSVMLKGNKDTIRYNLIRWHDFLKDDGGAAIYMQDASRTIRNGRYIYRNICLYGIGAKDGVPSANSASIGIYMDDGANHVTIRENTVAYDWRAVYLHDAFDVRVTGNTFFSSDKQFASQANNQGVYRDTITNNIFFNMKPTPAQTTYSFHDIDVRLIGRIDSNYWINPIDTIGIVDFSSGSDYNFGTWRTTFSPYDRNSFRSPKFYAANLDITDSVIFEYNASKVNRVVSLPGTYKDGRGVTYVGTITLAPYTSAVLMKVAVGGGNISPVTSITSPANNATFTAPATVVINATASDADGSVTSVGFYNGGTLLGTDNTSPYTYTWNNVPVGNYALTTRATDNGGAIAASASKAITVTGAGNLPPTVSITSPANNATYTSPAIVQINATSSDPDGSVASVAFYNGATLLNTDNSSPYTFTWNSVPAGTKYIYAVSTDDDGEVTASSTITITVSDPANINPVTSITSPANNATFTAYATITINANATDADGTISKVEFYNGATLLNTDLTAPYTFTWTNVNIGTYSLTVKATDDDNAVTTSAARSVSVINTLPVVSITLPANATTFATGSNITFEADATDANGTITNVKFYSNGVLIQTEVTAPYLFNRIFATAGTYNITAIATDNNGGTTTSTTVQIIIEEDANISPSIEITAPDENETFISPADIVLSADASDTDGTIDSVRFYSGSILLSTDVTAPYSFAWNDVEPGVYLITAQATDNEGAISTSTTLELTINVENTPPTVSLTIPITVFAAPGPVVFESTASDVNGTIERVSWYVADTLLLGEDDTAPYSFTWNAPAGNHVISAVATDNNNATTTSNNVSISVAYRIRLNNIRLKVPQ